MESSQRSKQEAYLPIFAVFVLIPFILVVVSLVAIWDFMTEPFMEIEWYNKKSLTL